MTEQEIIEQVYTCASCGYCRFGCAVYNEIGFESLTVRGRMQLLKKILEGKMELTKPIIESIYMCAQCENCNVRCPTGIDFVKISEALRETLMKNRLSPEGQLALAENLAKDSNPFREPLEERGSWVPSSFPLGKKSENLYFVGCTGSYSLNRVPKSIMKILDSIDYDYTILGPDERCCGSPILRAGDRETAIKTIEKNVEQFKKLGVKTVITACAGCHTTFKHYYPDEFTYVHFTQLFARLIKEGVLTFEKELNEKVIYYDGCDLGRHSGIYEEPRETIKKMAKNFVEMPHHHADALCCGAGGGVRGAFAKNSIAMARRRLEEAEEIEADIVLTECNSCVHNLGNAKLRKQKFKIYTTMQFINELLD